MGILCHPTVFSKGWRLSHGTTQKTYSLCQLSLPPPVWSHLLNKCPRRDEGRLMSRQVPVNAAWTSCTIISCASLALQMTVLRWRLFGPLVPKQAKLALEFCTKAPYLSNLFFGFASGPAGERPEEAMLLKPIKLHILLKIDHFLLNINSIHLVWPGKSDELCSHRGRAAL